METFNLNVFHGQIWNILPAQLDTIKYNIFNSSLKDLKNFLDIHLELEKDDLPKLDGYEIIDNTAIFSINGILKARANWMDELYGFSGSLDYRDKYENMLSELPENIKRIIIKINSPGGMVNGGRELCESIYESRKLGYDLMSFSEVEICSLGYIIAAATGNIITTKSTLVGSIGTLLSLVKSNNSETTVHVFAEGDLKAAGNPNAPLTLEEMKFYDDSVRQDYDDFTNRVALYRGLDVKEVKATRGKHTIAYYDDWYVDNFAMKIEDLII